MEKLNCWELLRCGREPGGLKVHELGYCPVPQNGAGNGINNGKYRGRICWSVAGTFCLGEVQGTFAKKRKTCAMCPHYLMVKDEEGVNFSKLLPGQTFPEEASAKAN
ncbi:MAG: hypothetical protein WC745_00380 [Patescibacteria group bacterium]|jgi:hypothetical protein